MEHITKDTHLDFSEDDGATFLELYGLSNYPNMGSTPDKVDVSNMRDKNKRYIDGLTDPGSLEFEFIYNTETAQDTGTVIKKAFAKLKEKENTLLDWKLAFPDGTSYTWKGKPTVYITSAGVGDPMKYKLSVSMESDLEWKET